MTFRDLIVISTGNLWRMKLRATLTIAGVLIAIGAFVSMVSFGAGNQQNIENEFNKLGLFSTMTAFPKNSEADSASAPLDIKAIERIAAIPGVNLVYPYEAFSATVRLGDSTIQTKAQALPTAAVHTKLFSGLLAGRVFGNDSSKGVIISKTTMENAGILSPDSALGMRMIISVYVSTIDSGLKHVIIDKGETIIGRLKRVRPDSLRYPGYREHVIRAEANEAARRFMSGFMKAQREVRDTLTVVGVRGLMRGRALRIEPVFIPVATASRFSSAGLSGNPAELITAINSGTLFQTPGSGRTFSQVTIDFDPKVLYSTIRDSVHALGYRTFSFAEQFEEVQKVFLYLNLGLAVIGLIALVTASLGIVNTMVMSINERRREIGVLKSLGADDGDIRRLFLVETGMIGFLGTVAGILFGWGITRIVSAFAKKFMRDGGMPEMELFAIPVWLVLIALAVGIGVSVVAGLYPAARASHVDPVAALRNE